MPHWPSRRLWNATRRPSGDQANSSAVGSVSTRCIEPSARSRSQAPWRKTWKMIFVPSGETAGVRTSCPLTGVRIASGLAGLQVHHHQRVLVAVGDAAVVGEPRGRPRLAISIVRDAARSAAGGGLHPQIPHRGLVRFGPDVGEPLVIPRPRRHRGVARAADPADLRAIPVRHVDTTLTVPVRVERHETAIRRWLRMIVVRAVIDDRHDARISTCLAAGGGDFDRAARVALAAGVEENRRAVRCEGRREGVRRGRADGLDGPDLLTDVFNGPGRRVRRASARPPQAAEQSREPPGDVGHAHDLVLSSTAAWFAAESFAAGAAGETRGATRAEPDGSVAARRSVIRSPTTKPTANDATSAAAAASPHRSDKCTRESAAPSAPKDVNIGGVAATGSVGSLEDAAGLRTTNLGRGGTTVGRGATGERPAAGGVTGAGATAIGAAIGRDGHAPRCRTPLSTSRLAPFSNRSSAIENSSSDAKGGASTVSSPRAIE